jgi:hypothetical protein
MSKKLPGVCGSGCEACPIGGLSLYSKHEPSSMSRVPEIWIAFAFLLSGREDWHYSTTGRHSFAERAYLDQSHRILSVDPKLKSGRYTPGGTHGRRERSGFPGSPPRNCLIVRELASTRNWLA